MHAREELLEGERLRDVVVGAALQPGDLVGPVAPDGEHDHREPLPGAAHVVKRLEAVLAWKADVEDEQVEVRVARHQSGRGAVAGDRRDEAVRPQPLLEKGGEPLLVLRDQDAVHSPAPTATGRTSVNVAPSPGLLSSSTCP